MKQQNPHKTYKTLTDIATDYRQILADDGKSKNKDCILTFAYNGTGKTRISMAFKDLGKQEKTQDTLYYNAFTEDLFSWNNDLENDTNRYMQVNTESTFFTGLDGLDLDTRIYEFLKWHVKFDFEIDYKTWKITFSRKNTNNKINKNIKISRGEESLFIWCFFLAIAQMALDEQEKYTWVKYIYIDDPVSSLDDNNMLALAHQLAKLCKSVKSDIKFVISTHHTLFFNVLYNEFGRHQDGNRRMNADKYFLQYKDNTYVCTNTGDTPYFYHIAMIAMLKKANETRDLYTYHFNILRSVLEKTAQYHGYNGFSACLDENADLYSRTINVLNHGNYAIYEPREMIESSKDLFNEILTAFLKKYQFNEKAITELQG